MEQSSVRDTTLAMDYPQRIKQNKPIRGEVSEEIRGWFVL